MGVFLFKLKRKFERLIEKIDNFFEDLNREIKRIASHPKTEQTVASVRKATRKMARKILDNAENWKERIDIGGNFKIQGEDQ